MSSATLRQIAWVGDEYGQAPAGFRLLLVAESFYDREGNLGGENPSRRLVRQIASGEWKYAYFTKVRRLIQGTLSAGDEREHILGFWQKVVFYHYVQGRVGDGPRQRPTGEQWADGARLFGQVVQESSPSHVIFLGKQLWRAALASGVAVENAPGSGRIPLVQPPPTALAIHHPSAPGYRHLENYRRVQAFVSGPGAMPATKPRSPERPGAGEDDLA